MRRAGAFYLLLLAAALVVGCSGGGPLEEATDASVAADADAVDAAIAASTRANIAILRSSMAYFSAEAVHD